MPCKLDNSPTSNRFDLIELENKQIKYFWGFFFNSIGSTCHLFPSPQFTNAFLVIDFSTNHMKIQVDSWKKSRFESIRFEKFSSLIRASELEFLYTCRRVFFSIIFENSHIFPFFFVAFVGLLFVPCTRMSSSSIYCCICSTTASIAQHSAISPRKKAAKQACADQSATTQASRQELARASTCRAFIQRAEWSKRTKKSKSVGPITAILRSIQLPTQRWWKICLYCCCRFVLTIICNTALSLRPSYDVYAFRTCMRRPGC